MGLYDRFAELGFRPVLLRRFVLLNGGAAAARELVFKPGTTGLERLLDAGKVELSMEAMMLRPEYQGLFSELELKEASQRLASATRARSRGRLQQSPTERN
jgi:5-methylcytosine-specific restriction protein A